MLGAGYGSLMVIKKLQKTLTSSEASITLINKYPYHYITTRLHEVAAGNLNPLKAMVPLAEIIDKKKITFIQQKVRGINFQNQTILLSDKSELQYDYLVIGLGSSPETFNIKGLKENAFFLTNIDSANIIKNHINYMFSLYKETLKEEYLTIVIGGAGFTGIELAGELIHRKNFLSKELDIEKDKIKIINIEALNTILPGFNAELITYAKNHLEKLGVEFILNTPIEEYTEDKVILKNNKIIKTKTLIWTGGVRGNNLLEASNIKSKRGRVEVDNYLRSLEYKNVYILGDSSIVYNEENKPYPPTAQLAVEQGKYLGNSLIATLRKKIKG